MTSSCCPCSLSDFPFPSHHRNAFRWTLMTSPRPCQTDPPHSRFRCNLESGLWDSPKLTPGRESSLLYKPYMDFLWNALSTSTPGLKCQPLDSDIRFQKSRKGQDGAEIHNWLFSSDQLRRIRFTYFDAGSSGQAFNSLLYPDYRFDLPLLGIDLLSFGRGKILCVVDFQPLFQDPSYLEKYTSHLASIRGDFSKFCSRMTKRIYNEDLFFSKELIFYRSEMGVADSALQVPDGLFFNVYKAYVMSYLKLVESSDPQEDICFKAHVKRQQAAYDKYSYVRDPAIKFLSMYFGEKWSERMAKEFLFPFAESNEM